MLFSRIVRVGAIVAALAVAGWLLAQSQPPSKQYVVLLKRGPKWVAGKPAGEQALGNHGRYLQEQMTKGALQLAGPFLDDSGGLVLYNARDEAAVRSIAEHGGMERNKDRRATSHNVKQSLIARFWFVPFNTGWHLAHHVDMGVPWRNLPRFHAELEQAGYVTEGITYPSYRALWRALASA